MVLSLRELTEHDEAAFLRGLEEWNNADISWYSFAWQPGMPHAGHLQILKDQKDKSKLPSDRVPSTMFYGFVDGAIVGRFNVRHELNDSLLERGGHVGYAVNPSQRRNGLATQMVDQGLEQCRRLGLRRILLTCADQNVASWKIIEKFGGSFENRIFDLKANKFVRRYWIDFDGPTYDRNKVAEKAVAYVTRKCGSEIQLMVFDHDKIFPDAGTQVPCGTVEAGEDPMDTLFRELTEESGLTAITIAEKFDQYQFYGTYAKKFLRRHAYHIRLNGDVPERWTHVVRGSGEDNGLNFHFCWIDLKKAKGLLSGRFDDSVDLLQWRLQNG